MQNHSQERILVIKLGALGDFIQALGPMAAIRRHHKNAYITLLTTAPFKSIAEKSGYFEDVQIDSRPKWYQFSAWKKLKAFFNDGSFSRIYDLQNNDRTNIYFKLIKEKPEWVGTAKGASHQNTSEERTAGLAFYGHVQTLKLASISDIKIDDLKWINTDMSAFGLNHPFALLIPGSAANRPEKRWPADKFAQVCMLLSQKGINPVLIGTKEEQDITDQIEKTCPDALNLTGKTTLFDIASLSRQAKIVIGNDTGPMHMAAPTGTPTAVLFTSHSNPKRHAPLGDNVIILDQDGLEPKNVIQALEPYL